MSRTSIFVILGLCVVAGPLITGCTQTSSPAQTPATTVQTTTVPAPQVSQTGMANPASVNCGKIGGTTDIMKGPDDEYGICTFPNGTTCEEWALFRGEGCKQTNDDFKIIFLRKNSQLLKYFQKFLSGRGNYPAKPFSGSSGACDLCAFFSETMPL